ncbi:reactive mitochondrial oxygen species modulator 1 domain-containing protein [Phthorimaea operculella]|nr:reactive mitochondrial oxygen species modulator 1 domain-containing protein [Phthorimaea operculella]
MPRPHMFVSCRAIDMKFDYQIDNCCKMFDLEQGKCLERVKMSLALGICIGMAGGAFYGGFNALRHGAKGHKELFEFIGKTMIQSSCVSGTVSTAYAASVHC